MDMRRKPFPFKIALNASTLRPFALDCLGQVEVASAAGYDGIELWSRDIEAYASSGGVLADFGRRIADSGIEFVNAISFIRWSDVDASVRGKAMEQAAKEIDMLTSLGCKAIAAPPFGDVAAVSLDEMAERFGQFASLARGLGIEPYLEFWGRSKRLSRLCEAVYVAMQSGVVNPKILLDLFHMHISGSSIDGLDVINGAAIGLVHVNDYPETPSWQEATDKDRLLPGDGVAPAGRFAEKLFTAGYRGFLSLELFIEDYGPMTSLEVAKAGLAKVKMAYAVD